MTTGLDYSFHPHPSVAAIRGAGARFVCRYISQDWANDSSGKNLLPGECAGLLTAGLSIVVVVEEGAGWMLYGTAAGVAAARHADAVTKALGMPGIPVYFAADFDAAPLQQPAIHSCLDGAASVLGRNRVGVYGGYYVVKRALNAGKATYAWQTIAWSGGQWDTRAHIRQGHAVTIGGASCDWDTSTRPDYGQWPRPAAPPAPAQAGDDDMYQLVFRDGHASVAFRDGCTHLRLWANNACTGRANLDQHPTVSFSLNASHIDLDITGAKGGVIRLDSGDGDVAAVAW